MGEERGGELWGRTVEDSHTQKLGKVSGGREAASVGKEVITAGRKELLAEWVSG